MFSPSRFSQLIKLIGRDSFRQSIRRHDAEKYNKRFGCWEHLIAMLYSQLSGFGSLREVETSFNQQANHHYHLGAKLIRRSTLADANQKRSLLPFVELVQSLMGRVGRRASHDVKELLFLIDATPINLKGRGFDEWTKDNTTRGCQGLKLHMELALHAGSPTFIEMTPPNVNDVTIAPNIPLLESATYVFDKGYCDYNWWWKIHQKGAKFVTRLKRNAGIRVGLARIIPAEDRDIILEDVEICLRNRSPRGGKKNLFCESLRRIIVKRPDKPTPLVLVTNDLNTPPSQIAEHYRKRWQIELFFKWIKQNLRIKRFLGRSENAVKIQILTALITYLLLATYKKLSAPHDTLKTCFLIIKSTLFTRTVRERTHKRRGKLEIESPQLSLKLRS